MAEVNWSAVGNTALATLLGSFAALWAQGAPVNRGMRAALYATLGFVGGLLFLVGLVGLLIPATGINPWGPIAAGLAIFLPLWPAFRRWLARVLPIEASSATHAVGLMVAFLLLLLYVATLLAAVDGRRPELAPFSLAEVVAQDLSLVVLSLFAVGLGLRRNLRAVLTRLGLVVPNLNQLGLGVASGVGLALAVLVLRVLVPALSSSTDLLRVLLGPLADLTASGGAALVAALTLAISREIAFRGALQPRLGLPLTAATYAAVSALFAPLAIFLLFLVLGTAFGLLRERSTTLTAIIAAAVFNLILVSLVITRLV